MLEIADDFIESVTKFVLFNFIFILYLLFLTISTQSFACLLAKHRQSDTLEAKDVQLHLGLIFKPHFLLLLT